MSPKTEFDVWWNARYVHTTGEYRRLYLVFKKLNDLGADLDTIEYFCSQLRLGNIIADTFLATKAKGKRKAVTVTDDTIKLLQPMVDVSHGELVLAYIIRIGWAKGRKSDLWGSDFVNRVTEYVRAKTGKPHDRLADELLRATRIHLGLPSHTDLSRDGRRRVHDRIRKLKDYVVEQKRFGVVKGPLSRYIASQLTKKHRQKPLRIASKKKFVK